MNFGYSSRQDYNMYELPYIDSSLMPLPLVFGDDALLLDDLDISEHLG